MDRMLLGSKTALENNGGNARRKQSMLSSRFIGKFLKVFITVGVIGVLVIQVLLLFNTSRANSLQNNNNNNAAELVAATNASKGIVERIWFRWPLSSLQLSGSPSLDEISRIVEDNNLHAEFFNEQFFGAVESVNYVIVVQVHNRLAYLQRLIKSLEAAPLISWSLLVFSHDYFDLEINEQIRSIKFCRVMQIFYPHSTQLSAATFPGQQASDCPPDIKQTEAKQKNCTGWQFPDKYGHYRNAQLAQIKHHWLWKANYVFYGIERLRNFSGFVLFLEEDHYVSPDFLYVFDHLVQNVIATCSDCDLITLGRYKEMIHSEPNFDEYVVLPWYASYHNMGMAFNRTTWEKVHSCSAEFCNYDDYNWDWSLLHISMTCLRRRLTTLALNAPRVFHIGDCGVHHKKCQMNSSTLMVQEQLKKWQPKLFPKTFRKAKPAGRDQRLLPKKPKENGGWGDPRDRQLCKKNSMLPVSSA